MAVCSQSGGLIDTGSLSVQDGLQLNQFGISNSPNHSTDSFHFGNVSPLLLSVERRYSSHSSLFAFSSYTLCCLFITVSQLPCFSLSLLIFSRSYFHFLFHFLSYKCPLLPLPIPLPLSVSVFLF